MRLRHMLSAKIHRVTVTEADVNYVGSITIDHTLLERVQILPNELVHVWNVTNGERFETYALAGEPDSGMIRVNGAGAHKAQPGDILIVAAFALTDEPLVPRVILVDDRNRFLRDL
jgi:aspartate 1-decarboxylase